MWVLIFTCVKFAGVFFVSLKSPGQFLSIGEVYKNKDVPKEVRKKFLEMEVVNFRLASTNHQCHTSGARKPQAPGLTCG